MTTIKTMTSWSRTNQIAAANIATVLTFLAVGNFFGGDLNDASGRMKSGYIEYSVIYASMTALCGLITYFGLLGDPAAKEDDGEISDKQMRFSIASTLLVVFLVYYCTTAYWNEKEKVSEYFKLMFPAFTQLLTIVLAFYFSASAAVDIFGKKKKEE